MTYATDVFQPLQADDPPVVGGYRLAARLGAGGMGRVYLSHTQGGRPVAIKVVRPELADDPAFRQRFGREIKAARRVRGAYTAELIDADADGAPPWLATLYVPGPSLTEAVARRGPLPTPAVLWLMAGVAEALQAIHGVGIVHRDLKPSNVLLAADGPRVIDFGISLASGVTAHTATGAAVGTPSFMAPEQASADEVTEATDVFALGQTAAFAALGEPLYGDGPAVSVLYRIVHSTPDLTRLPAELRPLLARCLAADPADRVTPAEILRWCRRQLDQDGAREVAPAVWREITGADAAPPAPGPVPTPPRGAVLPTVPTPPRSAVLPTVPAPGPVPGSGPEPTRVGAPPAWPAQPPAPGARRARRRRTALIAAAAVVGGAVLVTSWAWTVMDATDRFRHRGTTAATSSGRAVAVRSADPQATASARTSASSAAEPGARAGDSAGRAAGAAARPSASSAATPRAVAYPGQLLTEKNSLVFKEPGTREDRKGDIRLVCGQSCALESDTSVMTLVYGEPGATLDTCRILARGDSHRLYLAAAASGSEICVKRSSGDLALLAIQVKSTVLPGSGNNFVTADMTVWPAA